MNNKKKPKKYISLKEAAKISGYSPDYVGQLIREGKVWGTPVYTNITWRTTEESVLAYKNNKRDKRKRKKFSFKRRISQALLQAKQGIFRELKILRLFLKTFRFALPILIILILSFSLLMGFAFHKRFDTSEEQSLQNEDTSSQTNKTEQPLSY